MAENYASSAGRHYADAEVLVKAERRQNADQLYGLAAECAIKAALVVAPTRLPDGTLPAAFKEHVNDLWDKVSVNAIRKQYPTLCAVLKLPNPFADWSVHQRYADNVVPDQIVLQTHRDATRRLLHAVGVVGHRGN
ncbi:hypothetical protein AYM40_37785 (plasmid) [Paraburkholderia phytofirmans OLGA172]|uniref:HEPN domain-containing protein n=1 Tax=Paraburkholderia phytofirmans OLGA172 TaxID=1417228 RepID=A0A161I3N4_9BURK|nr:hypothetical protein [Paraburkholderia phytofirmans]ANB78120.1 hypothetical protein AYM40_37785 [Paraburkholderia phytofirmans OLGA172]